MGKSNYIFKGLGYAYIITLAVLLVYNLFFDIYRYWWG